MTIAMADDYFAQPPRRRKAGAARAAPVQSLIHLRVCDSGAVSLCGLSRFPVTLERDQWRRLLAMADELRAFVEADEGPPGPNA